MSIISILELAGVAHLPKARHLIESVILIEGYKEAQVEFGSVAGEQQAKTTIDQFRDLVNRNQVQGNERNIDYWRKQGWDQFHQFVSIKSLEKSKTQEKRSKSLGRSIVIHEDQNWLVVVPLDKDASCFHGKHTDWCTTKPYASFFEQYFYDREITLIYFLELNTGNKWAIAAHSKTDKIEMFDKQDKGISVEAFKDQTGFDPIEYRNKVLGSDDVKTQSAESRRVYREAVARIEAKRPFTKIDAQLERDLLFVKKRELMLDYCQSIKGRWKEAERMLAESTAIVTYVINALKGQRIPEIERMIRTPEVAFHYTLDVIKGRWPEAEPMIMNSVYASRYAIDIIKGRWPEAEPMMLEKLPVQTIVRYIQSFDAVDMIDDIRDKVMRQLNAQKAGDLDTFVDLDSAVELVAVDHKRWPELEQYLAKPIPYTTPLAIRYIAATGAELPKLINRIIKTPAYAYEYATTVGRRFPKGEPIILKKPAVAVRYAKNVIKGRWPEAEQSIAANTKTAFDYAKNVIKGEFPIGEPAIKQDPSLWEKYQAIVAKQQLKMSKSRK